MPGEVNTRLNVFYLILPSYLIATATTGKRLQSATRLRVEQKLTGFLGGDVQIAAEVATGNVIAVIFLVEPFAQSQPSPDTLVHLCQVHNVAIATNLATAEAIINYLAKTRVAHLIFNPVSGQRDAQQDHIVDSAISRASS